MIIYRITNRLNGKIYIGQTIRSLTNRVTRHIEDGRWPIGKALRKYGRKAFDVEGIDTATTKHALNRKERRWIAHYDCMVPKGYNLTAGGGGVSGWKASPEICAKVSKANRGRKRSEAVKQHLREMRLGKPLSQKHRNALKAGHRNRVKRLSPEERLEEHRRRSERSTHYHFDLPKLASEYRSGETVRTLMAKYQCGLHTICKNLHAAGVALRTPQEVAQFRRGRKRSLESRHKQSESSIHHHFNLSKLASEYRSGGTTNSLAAKYKCSNDTIAMNLRKAGVTIRNRSEYNLLRYRRKFPIKNICKRYSAGESIQALAEANHCGRKAIKDLLAKSGIPRQTQTRIRSSNHSPTDHFRSPTHT